ncbi:MAG TPA: hypothetical protein VF488_02895 [Gemmatimonadaceae bacterium]
MRDEQVHCLIVGVRLLLRDEDAVGGHGGAASTGLAAMPVRPAPRHTTRRDT